MLYSNCKLTIYLVVCEFVCGGGEGACPNAAVVLALGKDQVGSVWLGSRAARGGGENWGGGEGDCTTWWQWLGSASARRGWLC
jgi:hypothetical protein